MAKAREKSPEILTPAQIAQILNYDPGTGKLTWRVRAGNRLAGAVAGTARTPGYIQVKISGRLYMCHRLAWAIVNNAWPTNNIDHRNGDRHDNRVENLRDVTQSQNLQNYGGNVRNTSGILGVHFNKSRRKFVAQISCNGKVRGLGRFDTAEEARKAYAEAKSHLHTYHPVLPSRAMGAAA